MGVRLRGCVVYMLYLTRVMVSTITDSTHGARRASAGLPGYFPGTSLPSYQLLDNRGCIVRTAEQQLFYGTVRTCTE